MSTKPAAGASIPPALRSLLARDALIVGLALAAAAALAWAWLLGPASQSAAMGGMAMGPEPLSVGYLLPAFAMWAIMMVAMMVPSAAPMILLHARIDRVPTSRQRALHSFLFVSAYLVVWAGFAAVAALAQAILVRSGLVSEMALAIGGAELAAVLLLLAAAYELTAAKRLCLDKCRSPLLFIMKYWKPGTAGVVRLGLAHGLFCLGCCWALMLLLFVGGVMNLAWVAALGIIVLGEKLAPPSWRAERWTAAALVVGALAVIAIR